MSGICLRIVGPLRSAAPPQGDADEDSGGGSDDRNSGGGGPQGDRTKLLGQEKRTEAGQRDANGKRRGLNRVDHKKRRPLHLAVGILGAVVGAQGVAFRGGGIASSAGI